MTRTASLVMDSVWNSCFSRSDNENESSNYCSILEVYRDNGKESGNY